MLEQAIRLGLENFTFTMFILAVLFVLINRVVTIAIPEAEMVFRWMSLFAVGVAGIYAFIMHAFFPNIAAAAIGWTHSPFQYEVAIANLSIGILGILSFHASYQFRLAMVIGTTIWLWGDAAFHIYQMVQFHNFASGNAGSWFAMDILIPLFLILAICKLKPGPIIVREIRL